jgi:Resolvase, N terminal domain
MERKIRVAIYARVSTTDERQEVNNQLVELRRFAATQGWEVTGEYVDYESGGRADRVRDGRALRDPGPFCVMMPRFSSIGVGGAIRDLAKDSLAL